MRKQITETTVKLWLSATDTEDWATRPGESWPCSGLAGKRLFAEFDRNGLVDIAVNGKAGDCTGQHSGNSAEFNAITSDHLRQFLPKEHPAYPVCVGQFTQ